MSDATLVWFRLDLRLSDNPALMDAIQRGVPVIPVYVWSPEEEGKWSSGAASRWWLHQSLTQLDAALRERGSRLIVRHGPVLETIKDLMRASGATAVCWNRRYEPSAIERDRSVKSALQQAGYIAESFNGSLLFEPWTIRTQQGQPYQVFTSFWKTCQAQQKPEKPTSSPKEIKAPGRWPASVRLSELNLEPTIDWASGMRSSWHPGEKGALDELNRFLKAGLSHYSKARDLPDRMGTSRLSPYLHFGEIGPRQVWSEVYERKNSASEAVQCYLRELGWREFAHHLLFHFPSTTEQPLRQNFAKFPWKTNRNGCSVVEGKWNKR